MIKRTLEISQRPAHLSLRHQQLIITPKDAEIEERSFPCEDIGIICIDNLQTTYSHQALSTLLEHDVAVVICGANHLPAGMLLPFSNHAQVVQRLNTQIELSKSRYKQLWKQIVQAKLQAQARNLKNTSVQKHISGLIKRVRSGDPTNTEAQAARYYWANFLGEKIPVQRDHNGSDPINTFLNYGYAILRAAVARALVIGGFQPALGIHHSNRSNPYCLADDLMEPLRPLVDAKVRTLLKANETELNPQAKSELLSVLNMTVKAGDTTGPLIVVLHRMVGSLARCMENKNEKLVLPEIVA